MPRVIRVVLVLTWTFTFLALSPVPALASTGPYTLPFFDASVGVTQGYGCTTYSNEPVWSGTNADGVYYGCSGSSKWFHKAIDYGTGTKPVASSNTGQVVYVYGASTGSTCGTPSTGNHIIIKHDSTHYSLYYHLAYGSIKVSVGQWVSAGQYIADSGNTGNSCGAHLHYELDKYQSSNESPAYTYNPNGKWTTSTGRVPWLATYYSESNSGTEYICQFDTITHWVKFKNMGGRTWSTSNDAYGHGRIYLMSTNSSGTSALASQFQASDWLSSTVVTVADQSSVAPDGIGTFTFGLYGSGSPNYTYSAHFNLLSNSLHWFDYPTISYYYIPIYIVHAGLC